LSKIFRGPLEAEMNAMSKPAARPAAVAGMFYPASSEELRHKVDSMLAEAAGRARPPVPKALITPHAGYVYSGPIAASAYARIVPAANRIRRVVLLGPAHRVPVRGLAAPGVERFATPLGEVELDLDALATLRDLPQVAASAQAHAAEHSLEVQLPFLQRLLPDFRLVPLAVGSATTEEVAQVLDRLWGGDETLIVISSDLSHFLPYATARAVDRATVEQVLRLDEALDHEQACGATPINGLLRVARRRGLRAELLDLRNSGDTAGDRRRVVGYAALAFTPAADAAARTDDEATAIDAAERGRVLLAHARSAIAEALRLIDLPAPERAFLNQPGATFVTLRKGGALRGCIGSLAPRRLLRVDVRANARAAAIDDPRFEPLEAAEYEQIGVEVSVLSATTPLPVASESDLHAQLRAGIDGLILEMGHRRSTFLPQVWDALPAPRDFVAELKRKAGLPREFWSAELRFARYTVEKFTEREVA
jgi:AmmeMemoRadiSam system protein B/AmmeMemoRadiSam system protein A